MGGNIVQNVSKPSVVYPHSNMKFSLSYELSQVPGWNYLSAV